MPTFPTFPTFPTLPRDHLVPVYALGNDVRTAPAVVVSRLAALVTSSHVFAPPGARGSAHVCGSSVEGLMHVRGRFTHWVAAAHTGVGVGVGDGAGAGVVGDDGIVGAALVCGLQIGRAHV